MNLAKVLSQSVTMCRGGGSKTLRRVSSATSSFNAVRKEGVIRSEVDGGTDGDSIRGSRVGGSRRCNGSGVAERGGGGELPPAVGNTTRTAGGRVPLGWWVENAINAEWYALSLS